MRGEIIKPLEVNVFPLLQFSFLVILDLLDLTFALVFSLRSSSLCVYIEYFLLQNRVRGAMIYILGAKRPIVRGSHWRICICL